MSFIIEIVNKYILQNLSKGVVNINGRSFFSKYSKLINLLYFITKFIPNSLFLILLNMLDGFENKTVLLLRYFYVKKNSLKCGGNVFIGKYVTLKNIHGLELGENVSIQAYCYLDAYGGIKIGNDVSVANHTSLISFEHTWENNDIPIKYNKIKTGEIVIENDVWIGNGCRILADVKIQRRSIVAAGAVVNKNIEGNMIVGGVPARKIKEI